MDDRGNVLYNALFSSQQLCTMHSKIVNRVDPVTHTHTHTHTHTGTEGPEENIGDNRYVHYLDCGDGFTGIFIYLNGPYFIY